MFICPIYNAQGEQITSLEINDDIEYLSGRISKGKNHYYKGIGMPYNGQNIDFLTDEYVNPIKSKVFYLGYKAYKKCFIGKTGIFQERYQPQFTDFIGGCGVKELSIIENSMLFPKSSVEVIKSHKIDHDQFWFELHYECGRRKYLDVGFPKKLTELLYYMLASDWNFVWDKDTITDISYNGLVTDVADIFSSRELTHKLGTVYSVLYSLHHHSKGEYERFLDSNRLKHIDQRDFIYNSLKIMKRAGINIALFEGLEYKHIVLKYLLQGRNCGHCVLEGMGEKIRDQYTKQWGEALK